MPDIWMDVDAALAEVPINKVALADDTDFKTREDGLTYDQAGLDLVWNFVTSAGAMTQTAVTPTTGGGNYDWTNQGNGMYSVGIPASGGASINNDTEGYGWFTGFATGVLPWTGPVIGFRAAALNNALCDGGDLLDVNVTHIGDTAQTARDLGASVLLSPGTGTGQISLSSGAVTAGTVSDKTGYTASTVSDKSGYSLAADQSAVTIGTVTTLTNWHASVTDWTDGGRLDLILDIIAADTTTDIPALIATAQADLDIITGATGVNLLAATQASIDAIETDTGTTLPGTLSTIAGYLDTEIAAILADTNELQTDWANGGRLDLLLDSASAAGDPWSTALPGAYGAGTAGYIIGTNLDAAVSSVSGTGSGLYSHTILVQLGGVAQDNVYVVVTSDAAGNTVVASGYTNASGEVTFHYQTAGTYYAWPERAGLNFTNPTTITVS